ncbi:30S ribosome-binding factor RbfA [Paracoccaceae bacterium GXU_MW_L88]
MAAIHGNGAPSQRQLRVGEVIRRALSDLLMRGDVHDPDLSGRSITVGEVRMSPDLKQATAYVMPLGGGNVAEVIEILKRNAPEIRHLIAKQVDLKFAPKLKFVADETYDQLEKTQELFSREEVRRDLDRDD